MEVLEGLGRGEEKEKEKEQFKLKILFKIMSCHTQALVRGLLLDVCIFRCYAHVLHRVVCVNL